MGYKYLLSTKSIILNDYQKKMRVQIVKSYITECINFHKVALTTECDGLHYMEMTILKAGPRKIQKLSIDGRIKEDP